MINKAKADIEQYFSDPKMSYHSKKHTFDVFEAVGKIGELEELSASDIELAQLAALYHDTGYTSDPSNHEQIGTELAEAFLKDSEIPKEKIDQIKSLIMATKMDSEPKNQLEMVMKDADLAHLGMRTFNERSEALKNERAALNGQEISDVDWLKENIDFLENHEWYSEGAKKLYNKKKRENLARLKSQLKNKQKELAALIPEKGVETMYRVALRNHNQLSKIADNKANIMLSITAIMLSLILSSLAPKIDTNQRLLIPTILIILVNLVTMFFAIMATRPKVTSTPYTREKFLDNKINILFFGNFYKLPLDEFEWGMKYLMENRELLYGSLSKDLYFLGSVLAKKYRFLQYAYAVFMGGLIISTLAFVWAFIWGV